MRDDQFDLQKLIELLVKYYRKDFCFLKGHTESISRLAETAVSLEKKKNGKETFSCDIVEIYFCFFFSCNHWNIRHRDGRKIERHEE